MNKYCNNCERVCDCFSTPTKRLCNDYENWIPSGEVYVTCAEFYELEQKVDKLLRGFKNGKST